MVFYFITDKNYYNLFLNLKEIKLIKKIALITGITGQDGAYLSRLLLKENYEVYGIKRRSSSFNTGRLENIYTDPHEKAQIFSFIMEILLILLT